ncbi:MAG: hypothetical protein K0Q66_1523 [Chitinophagaceae bacterium]|jgi:hypothetical protein|nr:hypothetical protein [Chitinophagaceae bacterium]
MKKAIPASFLLIIIILSSCGDKVTKTLYGSWNPIAEADSTGVWKPAMNKNFLLNVEGKCEEIKVTATQKGDLANSDLPMDSARCYGNRDQLSFTDNRGASNSYDLKLDATKDTLVGTVSIAYVTGRETHQIKFARVSGGE